MKLPIISYLALISVGTAQVVIPGNPGKFQGRTIGGGTSGGAGIVPKEAPKTRYTTYITLSESRPWTSTEGKVIEGKLIAFEDMTVEAPQGTAPTASPTPPANPTVVRDGKIRLLVNHKPVELPLTRLIQSDQDFAETIRTAHAPKP